MKQRILVADGDSSAREELASLLSVWGYSVETADDGKRALDRALSYRPSVVIADVLLPLVDGPELLKAIREELPATAVILVTGHGSIESAVSAMKEGAYDYLTKPVDCPRLRLLLEKAAEKVAIVREVTVLRRQLKERRGLGRLLGMSPAMQEVYRLVDMAASTPAPVLIFGETGTGKELVARTIHDLSPRAKHPFVPLNCSAVPDTLLESELFGHERGAFTGALERRPGYFELANGGTIFLDEIAEMSHAVQAKYLRTLQDGIVRRLGGSDQFRVDVRVIAATNQNVAKAMRDGTFREDLYYRINVLDIALPPLRSRVEDIPLLVQAFVAEANDKYARQVTTVEDSAMKRLCEHSWPGNVRELRNVVERAVIASGGHAINARALALGPAPDSRRDAREGVLLPVGTSLEESERELIERTLASVNDNKTRAAHILGVSVKTLHNKLRRWRIAPSEV
jgi:DNA-binding NtrC family response regulator